MLITTNGYESELSHIERRSDRQSDDSTTMLLSRYKCTDSELRIEATCTFPNWVNDLLFSIPRFTKCLFRGDRDMYRRWVGAVEHLWILLYERRFGWQQVTRGKLTPPEYQTLYKALTHSEREMLDSVLPMDGRLSIPDSFGQLVSCYIDLCREKAAGIGATLDEKFLADITSFMHAGARSTDR